MRSLLVLGGSSGIGKAAFDRLWSSAPSVFDQAEAYGAEDFDAVYRVPLKQKVAKLQPTDAVFSIGSNKLDWIPDVKLTDFQELMLTNVYTFINLIRTLSEECSHPVNVVAVTSDAAWRPMRTSALYCASKAALEMAIRVASREFALKGWRINGVAPGKVEGTPMTEYVDARVLELRGWSVEAAEDYELRSTPLGRKVTKEEVAEVIEQVLFGPRAQTGEIIAVNGGR